MPVVGVLSFRCIGTGEVANSSIIVEFGDIMILGTTVLGI